MELDWLWIVAAVWFVLNLISNARRKPAAPDRPKPATPTSPTMHTRPETRVVRSGVDPTQQEGSRLEQVLRNLQRTLEEAAAEDGYPTGVPRPPREEVEETATLEAEPEVVSLENEVRREARVRVDRDDEAGEFETRRIQAAAARDHARTKADHAAFDHRIRQEPADHTATRTYTAQQLRDAMVWREVLGPPVSLREEER
jgi:hypothetical protein